MAVDVNVFAPFGCALLLLAGCKLTRPEQENYIFDGSRAPVGEFIQRLEDSFDARATKTEYVTPDGEPYDWYRLEGSTADLSVISLGDNRCDERASTHITFIERQYEVDLVFGSADVARRSSARTKLFASARETGAPLRKLAECPE